MVTKKIFEKVGELIENPHRNVKKLAGYPYFRLRIRDDYRILLEIQKGILRVLVLKVGQ